MRLPENRKFRNRTDGGKFFEAKFMYFFHAAAGIPFRVSSTFGLSRSVSDNPQTMSGLSGALMAPLHRHYKTARTETRRHLLLKIRQMPTQTSASRGYVLFDIKMAFMPSVVWCRKGHTRILKLSAGCGHDPWSVPNLERHGSSKMASAAWLEIPDFAVRIAAVRCIRNFQLSVFCNITDPTFFM